MLFTKYRWFLVEWDKKCDCGLFIFRHDWIRILNCELFPFPQLWDTVIRVNDFAFRLVHCRLLVKLFGQHFLPLLPFAFLPFLTFSSSRTSLLLFFVTFIFCFSMAFICAPYNWFLHSFTVYLRFNFSASSLFSKFSSVYAISIFIFLFFCRHQWYDLFLE